METDGTPVDQVTEVQESGGEGTTSGTEHINLEERVTDVPEENPANPDPRVKLDGEVAKDLDVSGALPKESPKPGGPKGRKIPPMGPPELRYAIRLRVSEVKADGEDHPPSAHLWNAEVLRDLIRDELPEVYEVVLLDARTAILFFGRRLINEGLELEESVVVAQRLSAGYRRWIGHPIHLNAVNIPVMIARQQVAQAMTRARDKAERRRKDELKRAKEARMVQYALARYGSPPLSGTSGIPSPPHRNVPRGPPSDPEDELVGAGVPDLAELAGARLDELDDPTTPRSGRSAARGRKPPAGNSGRRPRQPRAAKTKTKTPKGRRRHQPSPTPPNSPERGGGDSDSDVSSASGYSGRGTRSVRTDYSPDRGRLGPLKLEPLSSKCEPAEYLMWRSVVKAYQRSGYKEQFIITQILNSVMKLKGAAGLRKCRTVDDILGKLDATYSTSGDYDSHIREFYLMRQSHGETVAEFAARVTDMMAVIEEGFPDKMTEEEVDSLTRDRLFYGLNPDFQGTLSFVKENLHLYTYARLLDLIRRHEASYTKRGTHRKVDGSYFQASHKSTPPNNHQKYYPKGRMVKGQDSEPEEQPDSGAESGTEEIHNPLESLGIPDASVRMAQAVRSWEQGTRKCFGCQSTEHLYRDCPDRGTDKDPLRDQLKTVNGGLNAKGGSKKQGARAPTTSTKTPRQAGDHPGAEKSA